MQACLHETDPLSRNALGALDIVNDTVNNAVFTATVEPRGWVFDAPASLSLLEAAGLADRSGVQLASSCRNGTCRTCICQLRRGQIAYRIEWPGLSFDEKRDGFILPCVAYPLSDVVIELPS